MNILFLTSRAPYPPVGGERLRAFHFISALARQHRVTLLSFVAGAQEAEALQPVKKYVARCETVLLEPRRSYLNCLLGLFSKKPLQVHYYRSRAMRRLIRRVLKEEAFDLIFVHLVRMADYLDAMNGLPKIMDLTDALSLTYERSAAYQHRHGLSAYNLAQRVERRRVRAYETATLERFDCNLLISASDRDYLSRFAATDNVQIIGPGVNLDYFTFYDGPYDANTIIFMGKMSTFPNQDAALYFYESMLPLALRRFPRVQFEIVGIEPGAAIQALRRHPNVRVTGYVPDVRPYLQNAVLSVCPMRTGAGAKNKVLESLAVGTPVVATPLGVEGIDLSHEDEVMIADTPEQFVERMARIIESPQLRRELSRKGRRLIEEHYSWELVMERLNRLVESYYVR